MYPFVEGEIPEAEFRAMVQETYAVFGHKAVAPLVQLDSNEWVLELFKGPTLAFKDFALQLLGRLLDFVLKRRNERVVILGATSGDTGSAAIEGCKHCDNVDIFILHPYKRVSDVQRKQMTTVLGDNVFNIATCFYIAKRNYVMKTQNLFSGNVKGIEVAEESAFDLDTKFQLKILRKII